MQVARTNADGTLHIDTHNSTEWHDFVAAREDATIFHHPAWLELLAKTYGYEPAVLTSRVEGRIVAGLPLLKVRSRLTGKRLVSLPFSDHVPVLALDGAARTTFINGLGNWAAQRSDGPLKVHSMLANGSMCRVEPAGVIHHLSLGRPADPLWRSIPSSVRRAINKAQRNGVTVRVGTALEDVETFYKLHCATRRRQGTPVQPRRFFAGLAELIARANLGFVTVAEHTGRPVAAAIFFDWNRTLVYKYAASDPSYWQVRPNNAVIWSAIQRSCEQADRLDFGKTDSDNAGLRAFKQRWGATESLLEYSTVNGRAGAGKRPTQVGPALAALIRMSPPVAGRLIGEKLYGHFA